MRSAVLAVVLLAACSSPEDRAAKERLLASDQVRSAPVAFDWSRPEAALRTGAEETAVRLGSFEWTATVGWTVGRGSSSPDRLHVTEHHRVRQLVEGDFEVQSDLDPGQGSGSESGKHVVYAGKMTYARGLYAPFGAYRERPTDRGRDARRYRDESYGVLADAAGLLGTGLELKPAGSGTFLSRSARRFTFTLARSGFTSSIARRPEPDDEDTRRRLQFLEGRVPVQASGECLLDADTGVPLKVTLRGVFQVKDAPEVRAELELSAQLKTFGAATPPVLRPKEFLPDERKPKGVARALEAGGLKKRGEAEMGREEPAEEAE
jgi:hypothetical protein